MKVQKFIYNDLKALRESLNKEALTAWSDMCADTMNTSGAKKAADMLIDGDAKSAELIHECTGIREFSQAVQSIKIKRDVTGCLPCIPAYLMGLPKQMLNVHKEPKPAPFVNIYVNTTVPYFVTKSDIAKAGAKVAAIVKAIEKKGIRVNLFAVIHAKLNQKTDERYILGVRVKKADAPLNLLNMAFCFINEAFLRKVYFSHLERHCSEYVSSYGWVSRDKDTMKKELGEGIFFNTYDIIQNNSAIEDLVKHVNDYFTK